MCKISAKNKKLYGVEARQSFQVFRQITCFLGNNRALSKLRGIGFCITITKLVLSNYKKISA